MKTTLITAAMLTLLTSAAHAQATVQAEGSAQASMTTGSGAIGGEAAMRHTVELGLPTAQVSSVIAEGRARGATAAQIDRAAFAAHARLQASQEALLVGGSSATHAEIEAGAMAIASGAEASALTTIRKAMPADRSVAVSLQTLAALTGQGVSSNAAAADVAAMLTAGATDSQLSAVSAIQADGTMSLPQPSLDGTLNGAASVGLGGASGGVTGGVSGGVSGLADGVTGAASVGAGLVGGL